eukprot:UN28779
MQLFLHAFSKHYDGDMQLAYKKMNKLIFKPEKARRKRPPLYRPIQELQKWFKKSFPKLSIETSEECHKCKGAVKDVHIRLGWTKSESSYTTRCQHCKQTFAPRFSIRQTETFTLEFDKTIPFRIRTGKRNLGAYVKKIYSTKGNLVSNTTNNINNNSNNTNNNNASSPSSTRPPSSCSSNSTTGSDNDYRISNTSILNNNNNSHNDEDISLGKVKPVNSDTTSEG